MRLFFERDDPRRDLLRRTDDVCPLLRLVGLLVVTEQSECDAQSDASNWRCLRSGSSLSTLRSFAILTLAYFAPVKTTDDYLTRTVTLPKTSISLAELAGVEEPPRRRYCSGEAYPFPCRRTRPISVIDLPATELTLVQFVTPVECLSALRHRFGLCGNGSTILWGGDCSFGLTLICPTHLLVALSQITMTSTEGREPSGLARVSLSRVLGDV